MADPAYTPKEIFIVKNHVNSYSIYRLEVDRLTSKTWVLKNGGMHKPVAGDPRVEHFPGRLSKYKHDLFFTLEDAKQFVASKVENLIARMYAKIDVLEQLLRELKQ